MSGFTEKEWNLIICNPKQKSLHKSHLAANFSNDVLYGPQLYNGMGLDNLYYHQGIEKVSTLIQECSARTQTGNLIRAVSEGFRLKLGFNTTLGTMNHQDWKSRIVYE